MSVDEASNSSNIETSLTPNDLQSGFTLGDWAIEPLSGCFRRGGNTVHVEPKVMDVLLCLAQTRGEVVTRDHLINTVWKDLVVSEEVLTRAISELRTLLCDTHRERRYIRTVPKRGYALIAKVEPNLSSTSFATDDINEPSTDINNSAVAETDHWLTRFALGILGFIASTLSAFKRVGLVLVGGIALLIAYAIYSGDGPTVSVDIGNENSQDLTANEFVNSDATETSETTLRLLNLSNNPSTENNTAQKSKQIPTLAVMPFNNFSNGTNQDFFAEGLSEDIRNALITLPGIRVVARTSSQAFKDKALDVRDIGKQLGVESLVEGTVRVQGSQARITIQLTDTQSGFPKWSKSYDRSIEDVFSVQREISEAVVKQIAPQLADKLPNKAVKNQPAYNQYLLGRHFWHQRTKESIVIALERFNTAATLAPDFALAYSGLADAHLFSVLYGDTPEEQALDQAQKNANKALALDPKLAEAHASQGLIYEHEAKMELARKSFNQSVSLNPANSMARMWYGNTLLALDEVSEAYIQYQKALEIDPLHPVIQQNFLEVLNVMGRYQEVIKISQQMFDVSGEERLLKPHLAAMNQSGSYDDLLQFAVRYNFPEEKQEYASCVIADALISLQEFDKAKVLLNKEVSDMYQMYHVELGAKLALGERNSNALRQASEKLGSLEMKGKARWKTCANARKHYWLGVADYMENAHKPAVEQFNLAKNNGFLTCHFNEDLRISLLLYLADSQNLAGLSRESTKNIALAKDRLEEAYGKGWGQTSIIGSQIGLYLLEKNYNDLSTLVERLQKEGIQPWSNILAHPIFDRDLSDKTVADIMTPLKDEFDIKREKSRQVPLAKYGL